MQTRLVSFTALALLVAAGVFFTGEASGGAVPASCRAVRVSGGNVNGLTGGTLVAAVEVRNVGKGDCTLDGRPWIRLGPVRYAVTVSDATPGMFGRFGGAPRALALRPGQRAAADVFIAPGACSRARSAVFAFRARAGWTDKSVAIGSSEMCRDGTGTVWVGPFVR